MRASLACETPLAMIYAGYPPGSFNDARVFGWRSIGTLIARWWPIYSFGILAVLAASLLNIAPELDAEIQFLLISVPAFLTSVTLFRGRFALTPNVLFGIFLTYISPAIAAEAVLRSTLLVPISARIVTALIALIAVTWLSPKLYGAGCFYLLGAGKLTVRESFALAWRFIAGDIWLTQFMVGFVGGLAALPILIVGVVLGRAHFEPGHYVVSAIANLLLNLYYSSALMRIVSTSHELFKTYWEASENSAQ